MTIFSFLMSSSLVFCTERLSDRFEVLLEEACAIISLKPSIVDGKPGDDQPFDGVRFLDFENLRLSKLGEFSGLKKDGLPRTGD